jgi:hypothetical protein
VTMFAAKVVLDLLNEAASECWGQICPVKRQKDQYEEEEILAQEYCKVLVEISRTHATPACCFEANMTYINNTSKLRWLQQGIVLNSYLTGTLESLLSFLFAASTKEQLNQLLQSYFHHTKQLVCKFQQDTRDGWHSRTAWNTVLKPSKDLL